MENYARGGMPLHRPLNELEMNITQGDVIEKNIQPQRLNLGHYGFEMDDCLVEKEKIKNIEN